MNKKVLFVLILLMFGSIPINVSSQTWENEYGKLEVWPDTSRNIIRQKQYYNATWYKAGNNLDVAFCFDEPLSYGQVYYWNGTGYNKISTNHVEYDNKHYYIIEDVHFNQGETKRGYWEYDVPCNSNGKWDMYIKIHDDSWSYALNNNRFVHLDPWWDGNWQYKKQITIDHNQVPSAQTNFPVLINLSTDNNLAANAKSDGSDIAFVDSTETTQYNHEIEYYKSSTGRLVAWVNVTSLSAVADTNIYMYYGYAGATNQSHPAQVWDSDYVAVYHMEGSSWNKIGDSTSNHLNATSDTGSPQYNTEAVCGRGVMFDGTNDYITFVDSALFNFASGLQDTSFTIEAVFNKSDSNYNPIISKYGTPNSRQWIIESPDNNTLRTYLYDDTADKKLQAFSSTTLSNNVWNYAASVYDGSEIVPGIFFQINAVNRTDGGDKDVGYNAMRDEGSPVRIGFRAAQYMFGLVDEVRISNIVRSEDWLNTTYNTIMNASSGGFFTIGSESGQSLESPTGFKATTESDGDILLNWTMGVNNTHTRVEWNNVSNWVRGSGTLLYNDTSEVTYTHQSLSCGSIYYYMVWGYNSSTNQWSASTSANNISCPGNPTNVISVAYPSALNITWTKNTYADTTVVVRKANSYPSSPTDGTVLMNYSNSSYNDTGVVYGVSYYTLFTYNETVNRYSAGYDVPIGSLNINVYDENTSAAITGWDVFISNEAGTQVYESNGNSNTLIINIDDLPLGDVTIVINQSDYVTRIFDMTLVSGSSYFLNVYLAWNDSTEQYTMYVVGPENEYGYEPPIEDATIIIRRYINESTGWGNVSIRKTSASGTINIGLIPLRQYHVSITKSGYNNYYDVIVPPVVELEGDRYFKFRLVYAGTTQPTTDDFWDYIIFKATMTSPGYLQNGNITMRYNDLNTSTTNTRTYLYEVYNGVTTLKDNYYQTGDSFTRKVGSINTTRYHYVKLYFNNTASFTVTPPIILPVYSIHKYVGETILDLDTRIKNVVGDPPIGTDWVILIAVVVPMTLLVLFGVFNTGIGIISCGLSMGLVQGIFAGYGLNVSISLFALSPFIIVIGVIYLWSKRGMEDHL